MCVRFNYNSSHNLLNNAFPDPIVVSWQWQLLPHSHFPYSASRTASRRWVSWGFQKSSAFISRGFVSTRTSLPRLVVTSPSLWRTLTFLSTRRTWTIHWVQRMIWRLLSPTMVELEVRIDVCVECPMCLFNRTCTFQFVACTVQHLLILLPFLSLSLSLSLSLFTNKVY